MDHVCFVMSVLPGKSDQARAFVRSLDGARRAEFDASERRIGISKEQWFLASLPAGDQLIVYMESANFAAAMPAFVGSRDAFDMWFKAELAAVTGVDLNNPPPNMAPAELLSSYEAGLAV